MSRYTEWYQKNIERERAAGRLLQREKRKKANDVVRAAKNVPYADCGIRYPYWIMDFDHVRGAKKMDVNGMLRGWTRPIKEILAEIAKCDIVCSNCHRERTYWRGTWRRAEEFIQNMPELLFG